MVVKLRVRLSYGLHFILSVCFGETFLIVICAPQAILSYPLIEDFFPPILSNMANIYRVPVDEALGF